MFWKKGEVDKSVLKVACALLECSKELNLPDPQGFTDYSKVFLNTLIKTRLLPKMGMIRPLLVLLEISCEYYKDYVLEIFDLIMFVIEFSLGA